MAEAATETIDIVIADKSPLILSGLAQVMDGHERINLLATAADGECFMDALDRLCFDIGVIGWDMPYLHGRDVLQAMRGRDEATRVIVYTGNPAPEIPHQVMQLGGAGYCSKTEPPERLIDTVLAVSEGRMVFPFMDLSKPSNDPFAALTPRERELLAALSDGRANARIADDLGISLNTVKFHLKNLYGKLTVKNRAQAVVRYLRPHD